MTRAPTGKARVLRALAVALLPLTVPELTAVTGLDRRTVWVHLVALRRMGAVAKVNGVRPSRLPPRTARWRVKGRKR